MLKAKGFEKGFHFLDIYVLIVSKSAIAKLLL